MFSALDRLISCHTHLKDSSRRVSVIWLINTYEAIRDKENNENEAFVFEGNIIALLVDDEDAYKAIEPIDYDDTFPIYAEMAASGIR